MAEKFNTDESLSPEELAGHLRQPQGEAGRKVGEAMNKGNQHICMNTYKVLDPSDEDHILEIGMGNGYFVKDLLNMAHGLNYVGADFSDTMVEEAQNLNTSFIDDGRVRFVQASIESLPFEDGQFDRICTTNTLYFWPDPTQNIKELLRVLKPGGRLLIAYRSKSCMNQIELTKFGFTKYDQADVEALLSGANFKNINTKTIAEPDLDFDGLPMKMEGFYTQGQK